MLDRKREVPVALCPEMVVLAKNCHEGVCIVVPVFLADECVVVLAQDGDLVLFCLIERDFSHPAEQDPLHGIYGAYMHEIMELMPDENLL